MDTYYIWSIRGAGWVNKTGTIGSSIKDAKPFDYISALAYCLRQRDHTKAPLCFPVSAQHLEDIRA